MKPGATIIPLASSTRGAVGGTQPADPRDTSVADADVGAIALRTGAVDDDAVLQ